MQLVSEVQSSENTYYIPSMLIVLPHLFSI